MFTYSEEQEVFYKENDFPLDIDYSENIRHLQSTADNLTRSKVLHHPDVLAKKQDVVITCIATKNTKQMKIMNEAKDNLKQNKDCEQSIVNLVKSTRGCHDISSIDIFPNASLEMVDKQTDTLLTSFYRTRFYQILL